MLKSDPLAVFTAVAAFFLIGVPLLYVSLTWLHSTSFTNHALALPVSILSCFAVGGGVIASVGALMSRRRLSWNRHRVARLEQFLQNENARRRFPHRFIEFHHFTALEKSGRIKKHLAKLPPGEIIVLDCPRELTDWRVRRSQSSFEPIPWEQGEERLFWLLSELPDPENEPRMSQPPTPVNWRQRIKSWVPLLSSLFLMLVGLRSLIRAVISGKWTAAAWGCGIVLGVLAIAAFSSLVVGRRYFLVPGGLVRLENGLLFRKPRLELFTPRNASMLLYPDGGVFIASQGKVQFLECSEEMSFCLMLAWLNEARPPTMQELRTLLVGESAASADAAVMTGSK